MGHLPQQPFSARPRVRALYCCPVMSESHMSIRPPATSSSLRRRHPKMARLIHGLAETPAPRRADPLTNLALLLSRLQRTILHADPDRESRLKHSAFDREKAVQNVAYARSLLTRLEKEALAVKVHARRQDAQADLARKREVLDQVSERLSDLAELAAAENKGDGGNGAGDSDDEDDTSEGEDILADIIATPSESLDSTRSPDTPPAEPHDPAEHTPDPLEPPEQEEKATTPQPEPQTTASTPPPPPPTTTTSTSQTLRPRHPAPPTPPATTTTSALFPKPPASKSPATTAISTTEAILDHQRAEQDALSESILKLASELKASSHAFSASLDSDQALVDRAGQGMSKTGQTMEGVSRKMGLLTRMTEGEGWWGRMKLYGFVYGLMVVLVLVVGVLPKLRF